MPLQAAFQPYILNFRFEAGTSRGTLTEKQTWILKIWDDQDPSVYGLGEVGPLAGLSVDSTTDYSPILRRLLTELPGHSCPSTEEDCFELSRTLSGEDHPALRFGLETAFLDLRNGGRRLIFESDFTSGKSTVPINGLIWMGQKSFMQDQAKKKSGEGYTCMKMKIGAIDFEAELDLLRMLKEEGIQVLRVDANGAFTMKDVMQKLERLAELGLHSIEQPIAAGQWKEMKQVCKDSPVPVALDEELIGIPEDERARLLDYICPSYIILKPTLLGGLRATRDWVRLAGERQTGWWVTSALESNIGLNAIAQQTACLEFTGHQGLGTGQLYENNFDSPLTIRRGEMHYDKSHTWNFNHLDIC